MTEKSDAKCQELFVEIVKALNEYTSHEIADWEVVKPEILKLLKTNRHVKLCDYEWGLSYKGEKDSRIIVKEEEDKSKVREYALFASVWRCSNYNLARPRKCFSFALIRYGILFVTTDHSKHCNAKDHLLVMKIQDFLKDGEYGKALGLSQKLCRGFK